MTQSGPLDEAMFRLRASPRTRTNAAPPRITAHPALSLVSVPYHMADAVEGLPFFFAGGHKFPAFCAHEAASAPSSKHLHVSWGNAAIIGYLCIRRDNDTEGVGRCGRGCHVGFGDCGTFQSMVQPVGRPLGFARPLEEPDDGTISFADVIAAIHCQAHDAVVRVMRNSTNREILVPFRIPEVWSGDEEDDGAQDDDRGSDETDDSEHDGVLLQDPIPGANWESHYEECPRCAENPALPSDRPYHYLSYVLWSSSSSPWTTKTRNGVLDGLYFSVPGVNRASDDET